MDGISWIKITTDIFDNRKIKQIESLPDGDALIVIWVKLLCLAGTTNDDGKIYLTPEVPFTEDMLSVEFNKPINTIRLAIEVFRNFGMIDIVDDIIYVSNWAKYQNIDGMAKVREQTRIRTARYRAKLKENEQSQKLLEENTQEQKECDVTSSVTVTGGDGTEIDIDKDIDKEKGITNVIPKKKDRPKVPEGTFTDKRLAKAFDDWMEHKKTHKPYSSQAYLDRVIEQVKQRANEVGVETTVKAIELCIMNEYQGLYLDSVKPDWNNNGNKRNNTQPKYDYSNTEDSI